MVSSARVVVAGALVGLVAALVGGVAAPPPVVAAASPQAREVDVVSRPVVFRVENVNATSVACLPDARSYALRGRLVGPRREVLSADIPRVNVLVHDLTAGRWFWHLRRHPRFDYATRLARAGETSLVLDRLGYDASPLADGDATCLGAQADMLHQVVQHVRSGRYAFRGETDRLTPGAQHVVVHGHSVGAAIAQTEAATFDDVDGLVLMSWTDTGASSRAVDEASRQSAACAQGADYAAYGRTKRDFRELLFASAPTRVQRTATALRNQDPCGDALSLGPLVLSSARTTRTIEAPVLLLFGSKDARNRPDAAEQQARSYDAAERVTLRTVAGAGSALPLEQSAPTTRAHVLRWLATLD